jgi:hypothetical protein
VKKLKSLKNKQKWILGAIIANVAFFLCVFMVMLSTISGILTAIVKAEQDSYASANSGEEIRSDLFASDPRVWSPYLYITDDKTRYQDLDERIRNMNSFLLTMAQDKAPIKDIMVGLEVVLENSGFDNINAGQVMDNYSADEVGILGQSRDKIKSDVNLMQVVSQTRLFHQGYPFNAPHSQKSLSGLNAIANRNDYGYRIHTSASQIVNIQTNNNKTVQDYKNARNKVENIARNVLNMSPEEFRFLDSEKIIAGDDLHVYETNTCVSKKVKQQIIEDDDFGTDKGNDDDWQNNPTKERVVELQNCTLPELETMPSIEEIKGKRDECLSISEDFLDKEKDKCLNNLPNMVGKVRSQEVIETIMEGMRLHRVYAGDNTNSLISEQRINNPLSISIQLKCDGGTVWGDKIKPEYTGCNDAGTYGYGDGDGSSFDINAGNTSLFADEKNKTIASKYNSLANRTWQKRVDCGSSTQGSTVITDESTGEISQRAKQMASILKGATVDGIKLNDAQIAGIIGNFWAESGINPKVTQGHVMDGAPNDEVDTWTKQGANGLGLAQWTWNPGRAGNLISLAREMDKNWYDLDVQVELIVQEMNGAQKSSLANVGFFESDDAQKAAIAFHDGYERSDDDEEGKRRRASRALEVLEVVIKSDPNDNSGSCQLSISVNAQMKEWVDMMLNPNSWEGLTDDGSPGIDTDGAPLPNTAQCADIGRAWQKYLNIPMGVSCGETEDKPSMRTYKIGDVPPKPGMIVVTSSPICHVAVITDVRSEFDFDVISQNKSSPHINSVQREFGSDAAGLVGVYYEVAQ